MDIQEFASDRLPPNRKGWQVITTLDMHTGVEPLRIVTGGLPPIEGRTVLEKRRFFRDNLDHIRTALMWEPRGHADMYGAVVTPSQEVDFDVFFLHNEGYSTMCGHAVIALGEAAPLVHDALADVLPVMTVSSMHEAVTRGFEAAASGGVVLLAPACASFDWFADYAERGRAFKQEVAELRKRVNG